MNICVRTIDHDDYGEKIVEDSHWIIDNRAWGPMCYDSNCTLPKCDESVWNRLCDFVHDGHNNERWTDEQLSQFNELLLKVFG